MSDVSDDADLIRDLATDNERLMGENETLTKLIADDSGLSGAVARIKQLEREVQALRERNAGLMNEKNAAIRAARLAGKKKGA